LETRGANGPRSALRVSNTAQREAVESGRLTCPGRWVLCGACRQAIGTGPEEA